MQPGAIVELRQNGDRLALNQVLRGVSDRRLRRRWFHLLRYGTTDVAAGGRSYQGETKQNRHGHPGDKQKRHDNHLSKYCAPSVPSRDVRPSEDKLIHKLLHIWILKNFSEKLP